ncbi:MAG: DNA-binding protein [Candidatus Synechococcus spongiarum 15L]|uniref:DNA-binding protein n=1 Tax=Candidatus Synechococcus spongiarum 15L TaxID=1608419 RepID=A0A0G8AXD8_9SYNE|nr:MAG: DNA-binding protein [Candidatus Synechococcus spongiarum 15L]
MRKFEKPAISISDQVALLKRRGLVVKDVAGAEHCLTLISYYRLRPYWLPFEIRAQDDGDHAFREGTTFEDVLTLYRFDQHLRRLVLDGIEPVEVALRAQWAHYMVTTYGPHGYLKEHLYHCATRYGQAVDVLTKQFRHSEDKFAEHYRQTYKSPPLPPAWMAAEVMSFGQLLAWLLNLEHRQDKQAITRPFGLDQSVFTSFCGQLKDVRNICAHHGRLWNRQFEKSIRLPKKKPVELAQAIQGAKQRRLHNTLAILNHLLGIVAPETPWRERVTQLITDCPLADPLRMGFPTDWRIRPPWGLAD